MIHRGLPPFMTGRIAALLILAPLVSACSVSVGGFDCFFVVYSLLAFCFLCLGIAMIKRGQASKSWPKVPATIIHSDIVEDVDSKGNATYEVRIQFEYRVDGETLTSDRVSFESTNLASYAAARKRVGRYPEGRQVQVSVYPENPENCVLEPGWGIPTLVYVLGVLILLALGVAKLLGAF